MDLLHLKRRSSIAKVINAHCGVSLSLEEVTLFSEIGKNKIIYQADVGVKEMLAVAVPILEDYDLQNEWEKFEELYHNVPEYFPEPFFYHILDDGCEVIGMEMFPHLRLNEVLPDLKTEDARILTNNIGRALGYTLAVSGMYCDEPHENNILVDPVSLEVKLIDAAHYFSGGINELLRRAEDMQDLSRNYHLNFKAGVVEGMAEGGQSVDFDDSN